MRKLDLKKFKKLGLFSSPTLFLAACNYTAFDDPDIYGTDGDDKMQGTKFYQNFHGSKGADLMIGVTATDDVRYRSSKEAVTVNLTTGEGKGGEAEGDQYVHIEGIWGSNFDDHLTGNEKSNDIRGFDGNDTIFGLAGDDSLEGNKGDDTIYGGAGNDRINGGKGNDIVYGGDGDDFLMDWDGDSKLYGESGDDTFQVYVENETTSKDLKQLDDFFGGEGKDSVKYDQSFDETIKVEFDVLKEDNKIKIIATNDENEVSRDLINSIELISFERDQKVIDIKTIWDDLSSADQAEFNNQESEFLTWLGNDAGYNYEGL